MNLNVKKINDYIVINFNGSLDTKVSRNFEEDIENILAQYPEMNILLNMKDLKYLSSSGLKIFVSLRRALSEKNLELKICNMGRAVKDVFEMTKLLQFFKIYSDEESAIYSLSEIDPNEIE